SEACRLAPSLYSNRYRGRPTGSPSLFRRQIDQTRGDAQLEEDIGTLEAPPERERLLRASPRNKRWNNCVGFSMRFLTVICRDSGSKTPPRRTATRRSRVEA